MDVLPLVPGESGDADARHEVVFCAFGSPKVISPGTLEIAFTSAAFAVGHGLILVAQAEVHSQVRRTFQLSLHISPRNRSP